MRRFGFAIVLAAAALGFFLGFQMGYGNRIYIDLTGSFDQQMARVRADIDYFVLGSMVYIFGGIAARITKTGSVFVITAALIIISFVFGRQMVIGQWPFAISSMPTYASWLMPYFSGVFAVYGLWTFGEKLWNSDTGNSST